MEYIIDFFILFLIYILIYLKYLKNKESLFKIEFSLFYLYITIVFFSTIMPFRIIIPGRNEFFLDRLNLVPFRDMYKHYFGAIDDIILNIIMFIPFGFFYSLLKNKKLFNVIITSFLFSLFIELTQLLYAWTSIYSRRTCDVTDLITNTFGGVIGYFLYKLIYILKRKVKIFFIKCKDT